MPVGTQATVKSLDPHELGHWARPACSRNTYHLALRPGADTVRRLGGLHAFMGWDGAILTDSGGFQVWSLAALRELSADGVRFRSHLDDTALTFSPESVVALQEAFGADLIMPLDVCIDYPAGAGEAADAVATTRPGWCARSPLTSVLTRHCSASCRAALTRRCGARRRERSLPSTYRATPSVG